MTNKYPDEYHYYDGEIIPLHNREGAFITPQQYYDVLMNAVEHDNKTEYEWSYFVGHPSVPTELLEDAYDKIFFSTVIDSEYFHENMMISFSRNQNTPEWILGDIIDRVRQQYNGAISILKENQYAYNGSRDYTHANDLVKALCSNSLFLEKYDIPTDLPEDWVRELLGFSTEHD